MDDYYKKELARLDGDDLKVQVWQASDKHTKWMNLNVDCMKALQEFLKVRLADKE